MKFDFWEFYKFRLAVGLILMLITILGMPIYLPLLIYLNRPTVSQDPMKSDSDHSFADDHSLQDAKAAAAVPSAKTQEGTQTNSVVAPGTR